MKKIIYSILGIFLLIGIFMAVKYMIKSNTTEKEIFITKKPFFKDIEDKVMASGKIIPKEEIEIKPNLSGIIDQVFIKEGDKVTEGQLVATIKIVPNISQVNTAQQEIQSVNIQINNAKSLLANQQKQFDMQQRLFSQGVISKQEFLSAKQQLLSSEQQVKNSNQQLINAQKNLQIAKTGITTDLQNLATTQIRAKKSGTVLEVPVKIGSQVIEANSFNSGTTICIIADLSLLIFEGKIDEAQAGKLKEGMSMNVIIGALQNKSFPATLTMIAPKGKDEGGTIKFPVEASVSNPNNDYIRAGFSANGEIILNSQKNVLSLEESLIQYEKKNNKDLPFVEIKQKDGKYKKKYLKLGFSDGINIQILSGLDKNDEVKVWNPSENDKEKLNK